MDKTTDREGDTSAKLLSRDGPENWQSSSQQISPRRAKLVALCQESRKARGLPLSDLPEAHLAAAAWDRALRDVPTAALDALYAEAIRLYSQPEHPFGTAQLVQAWEALRPKWARAAQAALPAPNERECGLCEGYGYQRVEVLCPTTERRLVASRPCGCANAPRTPRREGDSSRREPLKPPAWELGKDRVWRSSSTSLPCRCLACQNAGKFRQQELRFDFDDATHGGR